MLRRLFLTLGLVLHGCMAFAQVSEYTDETAFKAALSNPTVINFDNLPNSGVLSGTEFQDQGVTITHLDGQRINVISIPPMTAAAAPYWGSLPNAISSSYASVPTPGYVQECCGFNFNNANSDNIRFSIASGASAAGIWVIENDLAGVTVRFRDFDNNVIYAKYLPPFQPHSGFFGITSGTPIAALEVANAAFDGDGMAFDDFVFQPSCVVSPPIISNLAASRSILWPPNHQQVFVGVNYSVTTSCQASSSCSLTATSNEPDNGLGDGDTPGDIAVLNDHSLLLRAERSGQGNGRRYGIQVSCTDSDNNVTTQAVTVTVPKSMK